MTPFCVRNWQNHHVGRILITVQLEPATASRRLDSPRGLGDVSQSLIKLLGEHHMPATWAVADPTHSVSTPSLLATDVPHELALLGDPSWVGATAGRPRFARELARRANQARASKLEVGTLVVRDTSVADHLNLVVKAGFTAICHTADVSLRPRLPKALHYGLWEMPVSHELPGRRSWFTGHRVYRAIRRAGREASTFHLLVNAAAIEDQGAAAERFVAKLLQKVGQLRDRGQIEVETLAAAARRLSDIPTSTPQRSIMRLAA